MKYIRHGDITFVKINKLPTGLKKSKGNLIEKGSHGNDHTAVNCDIYFKKEGDFIIGYLKAKTGAKLYHVEHSPKGVAIKSGIYEIRKQLEVTHEGMKPVID